MFLALFCYDPQKDRHTSIKFCKAAEGPPESAVPPFLLHYGDSVIENCGGIKVREEIRNLQTNKAEGPEHVVCIHRCLGTMARKGTWVIKTKSCSSQE